MNLSYRAKQRLKKIGLAAGILVTVSTVIWAVWLIWMGRFVVYSDDGASFVFDWQTPGELVEAVEPQRETVSLVINEGEFAVDTTKELEQISGYYITTTMLRDDLDAVMQAVRELPKDSTILLDLKNIYGNFYYSTEIPEAGFASQVDLEGVDALIEYINKADFYTVARIPAFRDRAYGLENTRYGLHHTSGLYLWYDSENCYWLDPTKTGTRSYLSTIATELNALGFDEVVFTEFRFPDTQDIIFEGSRIDALNQTAQYLAESCATSSFAVSFACDETGFLLPQGRCRLYRSGVLAADAATVAASYGLETPQISLVFLTEAMDTRFDAYGVLRPLNTGLTVDDQPEA